MIVDVLMPKMGESITEGTIVEWKKSVGEMITNMMGVYISDIKDIKCSGNWMWNIKGEILPQLVRTQIKIKYLLMWWFMEAVKIILFKSISQR